VKPIPPPPPPPLSPPLTLTPQMGRIPNPRCFVKGPPTAGRQIKDAGYGNLEVGTENEMIRLGMY